MAISAITVIGLGYVGLPLAVELSNYFKVFGFDICEKRVKTLKGGNDPNGEVDASILQASTMSFHTNPDIISESDFVIVTVPTPIDSHKNPDLRPLIDASRTIGENIKSGTTIVYESTVYPGVTEDICIPELEKTSGLKWKKDFFVGYSPERINPGDKVNTFSKITKVVSGDTEETLKIVAEVYGAAVEAGIHQAASIKVAEAAKVIENTQRDINIAFMNELKIIFDKMKISTHDVLKAAGTKWNFLPFSPGLVGGHCIGVDPYYLAYKAEELGHHPQIIMSGRRINDAMGRYFARELIKKMINNKLGIKDSKVLILGITFKENVPDIRNSRVIDIIEELEDFGAQIDVYDPQAYPTEVQEEYGIDLVEKPEIGGYQAVVLAVKHREFVRMGVKKMISFTGENGIFYDVKESFKA
ncbi:MAG: nucleotide sugar dehydrogenase [Candidatus Scalindua sp. AMX11]|nr:MAG: nucleotide sugar dehydrogenase [Candidatus Scalindua sp.]NOG82371.1 nucleotide sugar dehydrogenase [Planctomycetota bacterium]RZV70574.1 MAG: nucleotide sugar dehydrogenase [Candidatus Scalindua sp. SCAELEC01]TDE64195.1 MAG: nucleotide sugar dehydrogenase [Candidatus Scalindua sp. AMX11]